MARFYNNLLTTPTGLTTLLEMRPVICLTKRSESIYARLAARVVPVARERLNAEHQASVERVRRNGGHGGECFTLHELLVTISNRVTEDENGCWICSGVTSNSISDPGYPYIGLFRRPISVPSCVLFLTTGELSSRKNGTQCCHTCDVRRCVSPQHVYLGTSSTNHWDAIERGRAPVGEQCSWAKVTEQQVAEIRRLYKPYSHVWNLYTLAERFGIDKVTVWWIIHGRSWKQTPSYSAVVS